MPALKEGEVEMLYVQFRAAAQGAGLQGLMGAVERRAAKSEEYQRLVNECQSLYCLARGELLTATVEARMARMDAEVRLPLLTFPLSFSGREEPPQTPHSPILDRLDHRR